MKIHRQVAAVLKQAGATFVRRSKHYIFQLPNGQRLTVSGTPSDRYAVNNQLREIKQAGGLTGPKIQHNPDRRPKQGRHDASGRRVTREWIDPTVRIPGASPMAAQLSAQGVVEAALREQLRFVEASSKLWEDIPFQRDRKVAELMAWKCHCFICRLKRWWQA